MASRLLALALMTHTPVTVEVGPSEDPGRAQRLRGDLIVRLLEEGIPVADGAEHRVTVTPNDEGLVVEVTSDEGVEHRVIEAGPEAAVRLEVVHRTLEMVRALPPAGNALPLAPRVSVEARDVEGHPTRPTVGLVDALIERGTVVVPSGHDATWRLCLLLDGTRWAHMRVDGDDGCETAFLLLERADAELEADLLAAVARLSFEEESESSVDEVSPPAPGPTERLSSPRVEPPATRLGPTGFVSVAPGVALRVDVPDALVGLRGGITHSSGFGGALQVGFLPSRATSLSLLDTNVTAGPVWRRPVGKRLVLGVGALVGALLHRFTFAGRSARTHVDFTADAPLWLAWKIVGPLHLGFELGAGLASRRREHRIDGELAWRRHAVRLSAGVTLELAWGPAP